MNHYNLIAVLSLCLLTAAAPVETARPAEEFVQSIGVNVHPWLLYEHHHDAVVQKLGELGIRHVRDGTNHKAFAFANDFFAKHGIRTTFIAGRRVGGKTEWKSPLDLAKIDGELKELREGALEAAAAIEGPNEYDLFHDEREPNWAQKLRDYQRAVHEKVKGDPALRHLSVIGPSLTSAKAYEEAGDVSPWMDFACLHLYQSTRHPGTAGWGSGSYGSIDWNLRHAAIQNGAARPPRLVMSTESGYVSSVAVGGVPEEIEARYLPRMHAEFFRRGIVRTYKYELLDGDSKDTKDSQKHYGLLRSDLSEKPAFVAIKSLIALLAESKWDAASKTFTTLPPRAPKGGALEFALEGQSEHVHQLLLQKSDGAFFLLLWQEVESWEPANNGHPEICPRYERDAAVTLRVAAREVSIFTQQLDGTFSKSTPGGEDGAVKLAVPDRLVIVRLMAR